jgi:hypothetical protein
MYGTDYRQQILNSLQKTIPEQTLDATQNASNTLMVGVTTVRDVGSSDFIDIDFK